MQAAHPLAVSWLLAHTSALDEGIIASPGPPDRITARAMQCRVSGRLDHEVGSYPAGTPYRADDPELLLWALFTLVDSALVVHRKYVRAPKREQEADFWRTTG